MVTRDIQAALEALEQRASVCAEADFRSRAAMLEDMEVHVLARLDALPPKPEPEALRARAEALRGRLEAEDGKLFRRLREEIRRKDLRGQAFRDLLAAHLGPVGPGAGFGYDDLDAFVNGLFQAKPFPGESRPREAGMVQFQKTPVRVVLALVAEARLAADDVFFDVGAGLGQVALLVHLLTGARVRGVERDGAYVDFARASAAALGLAGAEFLEADVRAADYADGTVFFLYTPCEGAMLEEAVARIRSRARKGARIFTYGPCTAELARMARMGRMAGLVRRDAGGDDPHALGVFTAG